MREVVKHDGVNYFISQPEENDGFCVIRTKGKDEAAWRTAGSTRTGKVVTNPTTCIPGVVTLVTDGYAIDDLEEEGWTTTFVWGGPARRTQQLLRTRKPKTRGRGCDWSLHVAQGQSGLERDSRQVFGSSSKLFRDPGQGLSVRVIQRVEDVLPHGSNMGRCSGHDDVVSGFRERDQGVATVVRVSRAFHPSAVFKSFNDVGQPGQGPVGEVRQFTHPQLAAVRLRDVAERQVIEKSQASLLLQGRFQAPGHQQHERGQTRPGILLLRSEPETPEILFRLAIIWVRCRRRSHTSNLTDQ